MAQPSGQPLPWQLNFQDAASPVMEGLHDMHNLLLYVIIGISIVVFLLLAYIFYKFHHRRHPNPITFTHNTTLEVLWTIIPIIILIIIGIPSVRLLHKMEAPINAEMTIKAVGHQWYWSYEYPDAKNEGQHFAFDSYMVEEKDLKPEQLRLLDVDNPMVVPIDTTVRVLITATDVLHSFAVPSLGIKRDAVPERVNETWFSVKKPGTYYGQCSELCGAKHGFMPIAVKAVSKEDYKEWLKSKAKPVTKPEKLLNHQEDLKKGHVITRYKENA
jgi:cytochrome c oxidase subunit 2